MSFGFGYTFNKILPRLVDNPYSNLFGTDYFEDWDFNDLSTISQSAGLIDSITSKGLNAGVASASGIARPSSIFDVALGKYIADFDGISEFFEILLSTAMYNFLHSTAGGTVIVVSKISDANPNNAQVFVANSNLGSASVGVGVNYDDRVSIPRNNVVRSSVTNGSVGNFVAVNSSSDNAYLPQQYNSLINILDNNNTTAADRNMISVNGSAYIKNNVDLNAPTMSNSSFNMTIGKRPGLNDFYLKGQIARILFISRPIDATDFNSLQTLITNEYGTFPIT